MRRLTLALLLLTAGCCPKVLPPQTVKDSVRVEVREHFVLIHDTAYVEIPQIIEKTVTRDSSSHLENQYAESYAVISDGVLHHSLETKPQTLTATTSTSVQFRDTVIYRDREVTVPVEVVKEVTRYPKSYWWLLGAVLLMVGLLAFRIWRKLSL